MLRSRLLHKYPNNDAHISCRNLCHASLAHRPVRIRTPQLRFRCSSGGRHDTHSVPTPRHIQQVNAIMILCRRIDILTGFRCRFAASLSRHSAGNGSFRLEYNATLSAHSKILDTLDEIDRVQCFADKIVLRRRAPSCARSRCIVVC